MMDLKSDMTTDVMGPVTALISSQSEGIGQVTSPPVMNTISSQTTGMRPHPTNPTTSPFLNLMCGLNPRRWVWMWLETSPLHTLPTYQTELSTIVDMPIHMQWLDMQEVLLEFLPNVDLDWFCEALMDTGHWMGLSCCIRCEILDAEGLHVTRPKPWAPPAKDAEWVNPHNKQTFPPLSHIGRLHLYDKELIWTGGLTSHPHTVPLSVPSIRCVKQWCRIRGSHTNHW